MPQHPAKQVAADEILPPDRSQSGEIPASEISKILAHWLDTWIRIPGTRQRIGLDPIIALFPGIGDFFTSSAGLVILLEGVRLRISLWVLARMGANMLINTALNLIPGIGNIGSIFYKSNARNFHLIQQWSAGQQKDARRNSVGFFLALMAMVLFIVALWVGLWIVVLFLIQKLFSSPAPMAEMPIP